MDLDQIEPDERVYHRGRREHVTYLGPDKTDSSCATSWVRLPDDDEVMVSTHMLERVTDGSDLDFVAARLADADPIAPGQKDASNVDWKVHEALTSVRDEITKRRVAQHEMALAGRTERSRADKAALAQQDTPED